MSSKRSLIFWWIAALLLAAAFARLGFWQWSRAEEKRIQLAEVAAVMADPRPAELTGPPNGAYSWAQGRGQFQPSPVILLDNQQREGRVGVQVYGVFVPEAAPAQRLLVDLGWLPMDGQRDWPTVQLPQGTVQVSGLRSAPPAIGIRLGAGAGALQKRDARWLVTYLDLAEMDTQLGAQGRLARQVLRLDPKLQMGYKRDLVLHANSLPPERHVGYAVQWWGLALTVVLTALILTWRARKRQVAG